MEKFAVDLDKVLDEFEFNEDRAEQLVAVNIRGCSSTNEMNEVSHQLPASQYCRQLYKSHHSTEATPLNNESSNSATLPSRGDIPSNGSCSFVKNGISNPQSIYWQQQDVVIQNNINNSSHSKLNVSGVFSSLNEYLNAGSTNISTGLKLEGPALDDKTHDLEAPLNRSTSFRNQGTSKSHSHTFLTQPTSGEISKIEARADVQEKKNVHSETNLEGKEFLSSPPEDQSSSTQYDVSQGSVNYCVSNESELCVNIKVNDSVKTSNVCRNETEVNCPVENENATLLVEGEQPTKDENAKKCQNCASSFDNISELDDHRSSETSTLSSNSFPETGILGGGYKKTAIFETKPLEESTRPVVDFNSACTPVSFKEVDDYSKEELEKYLEELCEDEQKCYDAEQLEFGVESSSVKGNSCTELKFEVSPDSEEICVVESEHTEAATSISDEGNMASIGSTQELNSNSGRFSEMKSEVHLADEVVNAISNKSSFKPEPDSINLKSVSNLDVISGCDKFSESSNEGITNISVREAGNGNFNTTISMSMLNTSKSTANVTNVISIECQQTKNCQVNDKKEDINGHQPISDTTGYQADDKGPSHSDEKPTELTESLVHDTANGNKQNYSLPGDKGMMSSCFEKTVTKNNFHSGTMAEGFVVQVPKDSGRISVLGEEERPSRPKFLLLPSKIVMDNQSDAIENGSTSLQDALLDVPHETSVESSVHPDSVKKDNPQPSVSNPSDNSTLTSPDASDSSSLEVAVSPDPVLVFGSPSDSDPLPYVSFDERSLGKLPPIWVPDADAPNCMLCEQKFTVLKRRHHCRACGKVFCSKCCNLKFHLGYMEGGEARVCRPCYDILARVLFVEQRETFVEESPSSVPPDVSSTPLGRQPNPNNPMEYCSTIPPLEQAANSSPQPVPSVLVPVGVLKREGCGRTKGDVTKQVMFSDGIRPGGDLTELDGSSEPRLPFRRQERILKRVGTPPGIPPTTSHSALRSLMSLEPNTKSYIPNKGLPPLATLVKGELKLEEVTNLDKLLVHLKTEAEPAAMFALNRNLFVHVKILNLDCCVNRLCWCFSTNGMSSVGQDEIVIILEYLHEDTTIPKDIFHHLNGIYQDASRGNMVSEMGHTIFQETSFLGSSEHGGFIYIRPSFQCLHKLVLPAPPYLVAILFHRWEIPWAKVFPIRLVLRLGAEFRYYPCMLVSIRQRKPVFCEIGHTIINLLADFRNLSYTLPSVRGLVIHMEDRHTSILLPKNRYDQVTRALNNSNDHVLALAANFSMSADSHLVCIQSHEDESYHTQAINIHNKPRKVTGASFVVFNGALKISSNLSAKSSIVEDGLMVQITPDTIQALRSSLHKMQDFSVRCGPAGAVQPDETVNIRWVDDDRNFNIGVVSYIDRLPLDGVPSIRVHNGTDYMGTVRFIRWTEVFILQSGENSERNGDPVDVSRLSESLARATCLALVNYFDLLAQAGLTKIAVRANIHPENVGYEAGSRGEKLPPIYMKSLDNELVPVLHKAASMAPESPPVLLELIFHVMLQ